MASEHNITPLYPRMCALDVWRLTEGMCTSNTLFCVLVLMSTLLFCPKNDKEVAVKCSDAVRINNNNNETKHKR